MHLKLVEPLKNLLRRQPINEMAVAKLEPGDYIIVVNKGQFARSSTEVLRGLLEHRGITAIMVPAENVDLALRIYRVEGDPDELVRIQAEIEARKKGSGATWLDRLFIRSRSNKEGSEK